MQPNNRTCLSRDSGLSLVKEFYKSGQKQKDFCISQNIAYHVLQYWKHVHNKIYADNDAKFVPIKITNSAPKCGIKIIVNADLAIEVHQDGDLILLKSIIEICKRCG